MLGELGLIIHMTVVSDETLQMNITDILGPGETGCASSRWILISTNKKLSGCHQQLQLSPSFSSGLTVYISLLEAPNHQRELSRVMQFRTFTRTLDTGTGFISWWETPGSVFYPPVSCCWSEQRRVNTILRVAKPWILEYSANLYNQQIRIIITLHCFCLKSAAAHMKEFLPTHWNGMLLVFLSYEGIPRQENQNKTNFN